MFYILDFYYGSNLFLGIKIYISKLFLCNKLLLKLVEWRVNIYCVYEFVWWLGSFDDLG